jgi:hypothetical protein
MFTRLKYCKWGYMVLTTIAWLILASLVTLFSARSHNGSKQRVHQDSEQTISSGQVHYSTVRYMN